MLNTPPTPNRPTDKKKRVVKKVTVEDLDSISIMHTMAQGRVKYRKLQREARSIDEPTIGGEPMPGTRADTLERIARGTVDPRDL